MIEHTNPHPVSPVSPRRSALGLPLTALVGLAALGLPRVVLHDLHLLPPGPLTWFLALAPVAAWVAVAVVKRVPNPFLTVLAVGVCFGVMLVVAHQLLWGFAFAGELPAIGDGPAATLIPRIAAIPSGLFTGAMIGAIAGLVAWGLQSLALRRRPA